MICRDQAFAKHLLDCRFEHPDLPKDVFDFDAHLLIEAVLLREEVYSSPFDICSEFPRPAPDMQKVEVLSAWEDGLDALDVRHPLRKLIDHHHYIADLVVLVLEGLDVIEQQDDIVDALNIHVELSGDSHDLGLDIFLFLGELCPDVRL